MSKKSGKGKLGRPRPLSAAVQRALHAETQGADQRRAEAVTVAWSLSGLATCVADIASLVLRWLARNAELGPMAALPNLLLLVAALTGVVSLSLTPLVYRFRKKPPPLLITWVIVFASLLPWLTLAVLSL